MTDTNKDVTNVDERDLQREKAGEFAPAAGLDLRWRLADGALPLQERHLRALGQMGVGAPLLSWVRTRLEYVLENHAIEHPNGTLHIVFDNEGRVTFTVEPLGKPPVLIEQDLVERDGAVTGATVPGVVWVVRDGALTAATAGKLLDATATTVRDLAKTLHYEVEERPVAGEAAKAADAELFLTSDEFGVVAFEGHGGEVSARFKELLDRVLAPDKG